MSTRSQIAFYEEGEKDLEKHKALIYRHSDGYPEGVIPDILPFLQWWLKRQGLNDIEYASARLLQYLCNLHDKHTVEFGKQYSRLGKEVEDIEKGFTGIYGHGICKDFHSDIEYLYAIYSDKVVVYETAFNFDEPISINDRTKKIKTIKIKDYGKNNGTKKTEKQ